MPGRSRLYRGLISLTGVLALCSGCAWYSLVPSFTKATDYPPHRHKKEDIVLLMGTTVPEAPAYEVGEVDIRRSNFQSDDAMLDAMRQLGVQYGFDGVDQIQCGDDDNAAWRCTGYAFVFK